LRNAQIGECSGGDADTLAVRNVFCVNAIIFRVGIKIVYPQDRIEILAGLEQQARPAAEIVHRREVSVIGRVLGRVMGITVDVEIRPRGPQRQLVGHERNVHRPLGLVAAIIADARRHVAAIGLQIGLDRINAHRAAGGVAALQRALGAAQHFHTIDIEQRHRCQCPHTLIGAVDIKRDRARLAGLKIRLRHTANGELRLFRAERQHHLHIRNLGADIKNIVDVLLLEILAAQHLDRDRHILRLLRPLLCGNHHFFKLAGFHRRRLRPRGNDRDSRQASQA
jgi:hypothetical protein